MAVVKHQQVDSPAAMPHWFGASHSGQRSASLIRIEAYSTSGAMADEAPRASSDAPSDVVRKRQMGEQRVARSRDARSMRVPYHALVLTENASNGRFEVRPGTLAAVVFEEGG